MEKAMLAINYRYDVMFVQSHTSSTHFMARTILYLDVTDPKQCLEIDKIA